MTLTPAQQMKYQLKRTWHTFFVRYNRFQEIQVRAIPIVLSKKNAILVSSTASGKTEAVIAPLCERILNEKRTGLSVLYVTPTRALANDLYYRLKDQITSLEITFDKKTGDSPHINWEKVPNILVTTPESLDSIICRHPGTLNNLIAVVLDEIHLIDGTYRGDQLRLLLQRLRKKSSDFAVYALSATISRPEEVADRYMEAAEVIQVPGSRTIKETYVPSLKEVYEHCRLEKIKKLLIFSNSRKNAELTYLEAKRYWPSREVVVHHGMLDRKVRLESECAMKTMRRAVCSATMTLEIGIDIGDIEAVVLSQVPFEVTSLLQRTGRAGRRTGIIRVFAITANDETTLAFREMFESARQNLLENYTYSEDFSVVIQQIYSLLFSNRAGIVEDDLISVFEGFCSHTTLKEILIPYLISNEKIIRKMNKIYASQEVMDLGEKGSIHSNIPNTTTIEIFDTTRRQTIGDIQFRNDRIELGICFLLAGRSWEIVQIQKTRISVKPVSKTAGQMNFPPTPRVGAFFFDLPEELQKEMVEKKSFV